MRVQDLNLPQQQAVQTISGPVLILAGAGTGKTRVITTRICYLLAQDVRPEHILAVTFTNKAATEMKERVGHMTPKGVAQKLTISTFHSLCVRILRQDIERLGYKKNFTIYTGSEQIGLVRRIIAQKAPKGEKLEPDAALSQISRYRNKGVPPGDSQDALIMVIMREYVRQLKLLNAVDFDDLLLLGVKVLQQHPEVRDAWRARYRYLMVDEFQDTNKLQLDLIRNLTGTHMNICVVGDDDQSIYGWRGAEISNILDFERYFPNPTVVKLEENYRSTNPILNTANGLIRHNQNRREKKLWSSRESDELVKLIAMPGEVEEAEYVVEDLLTQKIRDNLEYEAFCVLFRTNAQTRLFEEGMRNNKIPYRIIGGRSFFDRREIKDVLAWLNVLVNPDDDINLLRILNTPPRGIGDTVIEMATDVSREREESIYKTLTNGALDGQLSTRAGGAVSRFREIIAEWQEQLAGPWNSLADMTAALLKAIEYIPWLKRQCKNDEEGAMRESGINDLLETIRRREVKDEAALVEFLASICLDDDRDSKDDLDKKKGVCLITMHAAKGLEFPHVYIPGLEEGILPHKRSIEEGTRDEERRLLYVGITRAMRRLTLTYCGTRMRWGDALPCQPSSFLRELDPKYVERTTWNEIRNRVVTQDEAKDRFSALRQLLGG